MNVRHTTFKNSDFMQDTHWRLNIIHHVNLAEIKITGHSGLSSTCHVRVWTDDIFLCTIITFSNPSNRILWMLNDGLKGPSVLCRASPTTCSTLVNISPAGTKRYNCNWQIIIVTSAVVPAYTIKLGNFTTTQIFINEIWDLQGSKYQYYGLLSCQELCMKKKTQLYMKSMSIWEWTSIDCLSDYHEIW